MYRVTADGTRGGEVATIYSRHDFREAVRTIKRAVDMAWQWAITDAPDSWVNQLPPVIQVPLEDEFERIYTGQYDLTASAGDEVPDKTMIIGTIRWKRLNYRTGPHKLDRVVFFFEDCPDVEVWSEKV
jgi:hypothetical protein